MLGDSPPFGEGDYARFFDFLAALRFGAALRLVVFFTDLRFVAFFFAAMFISSFLISPSDLISNRCSCHASRRSR